jgi:hypothetical protein
LGKLNAMKKIWIIIFVSALPILLAAQVTEKHLPKADTVVKRYVLAANRSVEAASLPTTVIPAFDAQKMPFFCRLEYQCNQKSALPIYFRLGDLQYVNELEGKNRH